MNLFERAHSLYCVHVETAQGNEAVVPHSSSADATATRAVAMTGTRITLRPFGRCRNAYALVYGAESCAAGTAYTVSRTCTVMAALTPAGPNVLTG